MFKVGDMVRALVTRADKDQWIGSMYYVTHIQGPWFSVRGGHHKVYHSSEFELYMNPETANTGSFFVFNMTTRGTPRKPHNTFAEAKAEANRLAEATPNQEFVVLEPTYSVKKVPQFVTEEQTYSISH